jgi:hypothetical protein
VLLWLAQQSSNKAKKYAIKNCCNYIVIPNLVSESYGVQKLIAL